VAGLQRRFYEQCINESTQSSSNDSPATSRTLSEISLSCSKAVLSHNHCAFSSTSFSKLWKVYVLGIFTFGWKCFLFCIWEILICKLTVKIGFVFVLMVIITYNCWDSCGHFRKPPNHKTKYSNCNLCECENFKTCCYCCEKFIAVMNGHDMQYCIFKKIFLCVKTKPNHMSRFMGRWK
jgi:hypothetical protein